jgi:DNA-binding transcriptional MocR family regulator
MFFNVSFNNKQPIYEKVYNKLKEMIEEGLLPPESKLPSTRELALMTKVSRSTILTAYEMLENNEFVYTLQGKGTFVSKIKVRINDSWNISWNEKINDYGRTADNLDIMKNELMYEKGVISFRSIAPDEGLFDVEEIKRAFLNVISLNGNRILNYGYARGYLPLINYIHNYMERKGVNTKNKSIIITNGFTEGFDMVLSAITSGGDTILCENPTHNTAIKLMKLNNLNIIGFDIEKDGINRAKLKYILQNNKVKVAYLTPSYHNPTGMVMSHKDRKIIYNLFKEYNVPIIEDGFNEELQHLSTHIAPIAAISGKENGVIYIGSLSKILFPGIRIGWILADNILIDILESVKRSRNIHTSTLDQAILHEYLKSGSFERYIKKVRNIYKEKSERVKELIDKYVSHDSMYECGGLYVFIKLKDINSRDLLGKCYKRGVIFTPGDIFYIDNGRNNTLRLGFSRLSIEEIEKGIKIIGEEILRLKNK